MPQRFLVPHPDDCTKFFSCQFLGRPGKYKAHMFNCPVTTGFSDNLMICNFATPACRKARMLDQRQEGRIERKKGRRKN